MGVKPGHDGSDARLPLWGMKKSRSRGACRIVAAGISAVLISAATIAALATTPTVAFAYEYEHLYCDQSLAVDGTCPPNGSSQTIYLALNLASAGTGESRETCDDDYLLASGYTSAACMYYYGEWAEIYEPSEPAGYPRAWNGGKVTHLVYALEWGHTNVAGPIKPANASSTTTAVSGGASSAVASQIEEAIHNGAAVDAGPASIMRGTTYTCLTDAEEGVGGARVGVCGSRSDVERRGLALATENASGVPVVIGLTPGGNRSVKVTNAGGTTESVSVINDVYEIEGGSPSAVTLKAAAGNETTRQLPTLLQPPVLTEPITP